MNRLLRSLLGPTICAGVLVSGYLLASAAPATPGLDVNRLKSHDRAAAAQAPRPASQAKPESKIVAARPPVPLLAPSHTTFFEEAQPATTTVSTATADALAPQPQDKTDSKADSSGPNASVLSAKAMIEADGYKNVSGLVKAPDGTWTGVALRGATQVAIKVDASGSVSQQ
jgi:hypothetical protein